MNNADERESSGANGIGENAENLRVLYQNVNDNFRKLTEIRFALLGLTPLGTGIAVVLKDSTDPAFFAFGAIITVALWVYDERNSQHYDELVGQAADLERKLGIVGGPFDARPAAWWYLLPAQTGRRAAFAVEHRWPLLMIYGATLVAWLGQFLAGVVGALNQGPAAKVAAWCVAASFVAVATNLILESHKDQKAKFDKLVKAAHSALKEYDPSRNDERHREAVVFACKALCDDPSMVDARWTYLFEVDAESTYPHLQPFGFKYGKLGPRVAALVLAAFIDMPPRWIEDISGRRSKGAPLQEPKEQPSPGKKAKKRKNTTPPKRGAWLVTVLLITTGFAWAAACGDLRRESPVVTPASSGSTVPSAAPALSAPVLKKVPGSTPAPEISAQSQPIRQPLSYLASAVGIVLVVAGGLLLIAKRTLTGTIVVTTGSAILAASVLSRVTINPKAEWKMFDNTQLCIACGPGMGGMAGRGAGGAGGVDVGGAPQGGTGGSAGANVSGTPSGGNGPGAHARRMFYLFSVGAYNSGAVTPNIDMSRDLKDQLIQHYCGDYEKLTLVGHADVQTLTAQTEARFVSNRALAERRASEVRDALDKLLTGTPCVPPEGIDVMPSGPDDIGAPAPAAMSKDRRVDVYGDVKLARP